jgi:hypothetical protein
MYCASFHNYSTVYTTKKIQSVKNTGRRAGEIKRIARYCMYWLKKLMVILISVALQISTKLFTRIRKLFETDTSIR